MASRHGRPRSCRLAHLAVSTIKPAHPCCRRRASGPAEQISSGEQAADGRVETKNAGRRRKPAHPSRSVVVGRPAWALLVVESPEGASPANHIKANCSLRAAIRCVKHERGRTSKDGQGVKRWGPIAVMACLLTVALAGCATTLEPQNKQRDRHLTLLYFI
jgi:hypothetical protein